MYFGFFGDPSPDWTFAAGAPVQILLPLSRKIVIDLTEVPQYVYYLDTAEERAFNNTFRGRLHFDLNRFYFQAGGGLASVRRRFSPELDINIRERRNSLDGTAFWQASRSMSIAALFERADFDYGDAVYLDATLAELLNRFENRLDIVTHIQSGPRLRVLVNGQIGTYDFTGGVGQDRDAKSYGVYGGLEFAPRQGDVSRNSRFRGGFKIGYLRLDLVDPEAVDGAGLAGEADVTVDLSGRTSARIFVSRGFQFSVFTGSSFYLSTVCRSGLSHRLSRRTTATYDLTIGQSVYPGTGETEGRSDRFLAHSFALGFQISRPLGILLSGTLGQRNRDSEDTAHYRNTFGISLTYGFPMSEMSSLLGELIR